MNIFLPNIFSRKRTLLWFMVILFVLTLLLRVNVLLEPLGTDQGIFSYVAMCLKSGDTVYKDVVDHKPPLIFYLYQTLYTLAPPGKVTLFVFDTLYLFLFTLLIGWFVERYIVKHGFAPASLLFLFLMCTKSLYEGGNQTETYMVLFQFLFYLGLWRYWKGTYRPLDLFLSGMALAIAGLWKPVALIAIVPAGLLLVYHTFKTPRTKRRYAPFLLMPLGFLVPHLALFIYYNKLHIWDAYVFTTYLFDIVLKQHYPGEGNSFFMNAFIFLREQVFALAFLWATYSFFIYELLARTGVFKKYRDVVVFWGMFLMFDILAAVIGGRFFGHYFVQPLVAATILAIVIFRVFSEKRKRYLFVIGMLLLVAICFQTLKVSTAHLRHPVDVSRTIGEYLKVRTTTGDTIYVNGVKTGINFFAERKAPWKYVHDIFIRVADEQMMVQECNTMLAKRPRYIVITNPNWIFPPVQEALRTRYRNMDQLFGYTIYRLR